MPRLSSTLSNERRRPAASNFNECELYGTMVERRKSALAYIDTRVSGKLPSPALLATCALHWLT